MNFDGLGLALAFLSPSLLVEEIDDLVAESVVVGIFDHRDMGAGPGDGDIENLPDV